MPAAEAPGMETITFTLTLPQGAKSPIVLAVGGADADRDGKIEKDSEVAAFTRKDGHVWIREQSVELPTDHMLFVVFFTVGSGVPWTLEITNGAGKPLFRSANTTVFATETVSFFL